MRLNIFVARNLEYLTPRRYMPSCTPHNCTPFHSSGLNDRYSVFRPFIDFSRTQMCLHLSSHVLVTNAAFFWNSCQDGSSESRTVGIRILCMHESHPDLSHRDVIHKVRTFMLDYYKYRIINYRPVAEFR